MKKIIAKLIIFFILLLIIIFIVTLLIVLVEHSKSKSPQSKENENNTELLEEPEEKSEEIVDFLATWTRAWKTRDITSMINLYSLNFNSRGMDWSELNAYHNDIFNSYSHINIEIEDIKVSKPINLTAGMKCVR